MDTTPPPPPPHPESRGRLVSLYQAYLLLSWELTDDKDSIKSFKQWLDS